MPVQLGQDSIGPILDADLLWLIFSLVTSEESSEVDTIEDNAKRALNAGRSFEDKPLYILRRSSQVCRLWRDVILGNATFWADTIEVELLAFQRNDYWRCEVLRRTGTALLTVKGYISEREEFVSLDGLLQTHWSRLRKLDIWMKDWTWTWVNTTTWDVLGQPTNHLEFFNFSVLPETKAACTPAVRQGRNRFSDHAPTLRKFHSSHMITFSLTAPWLSQITHITFSTPTFTIPQILSALDHMPLVEAFYLRKSIQQFGSLISSLESKVNLPRLKRVTICHTLTTALAILGRMAPAPGCCLYLRTTDTETNRMTVPMMNLIHNVLSRYFQSYFHPNHRHHEVPRLSINLTQYNCLLVGPFSTSTSQPGFDIDIFHGGGLPPAWLSMFLSVFLRHGCDLGHITVLELCGMTGLSPVDPDLTDFLVKFKSVKELRIFSPDILELILRVPPWDRGLVIFPSLETMQLVSWGKLKPKPILSFLKWRQQLGVPIQALHIVSQNRTGVRADLRDFAQFDGMKIIWSEKGSKENYVGQVAERILRWAFQKNVSAMG